jgi:hypothetical protein
MHISPYAFDAVILIVSLSACAGRAPQLVAIVQPTDPQMDCAAISFAAQANNAKLQALGAEEGNKVGQNVAAGVVGLFIWPVWFAMDFQGAADKEEAAINARNQHLAVMAQQRHCGAPEPVPSAAPATQAPYRGARR